MPGLLDLHQDARSKRTRRGVPFEMQILENFDILARHFDRDVVGYGEIENISVEKSVKHRKTTAQRRLSFSCRSRPTADGHYHH